MKIYLAIRLYLWLRPWCSPLLFWLGKKLIQIREDSEFGNLILGHLALTLGHEEEAYRYWKIAFIYPDLNFLRGTSENPAEWMDRYIYLIDKFEDRDQINHFLGMMMSGKYNFSESLSDRTLSWLLKSNPIAFQAEIELLRKRLTPTLEFLDIKPIQDITSSIKKPCPFV